LIWINLEKFKNKRVLLLTQLQGKEFLFFFLIFL